MIQEHDALLFFDLDKQGPTVGTAEARRLDARLRPAWLQFQALRALALEAGPEPSEKLLREVLSRCRRAPQGADRKSFPAATGSGENRQFPRGLTMTLAAGILAVVWLAFHLGSTDWGSTHPDLARALGVPSIPSNPPFEFSSAIPPVTEALSEPGDRDDQDGGQDADDVHEETKVERQAGRLLRAQLHAAQRRHSRGKRRKAASKPKGHSRPKPVPAPQPAPDPGPSTMTPNTVKAAALVPSMSLASDELWSVANATAAPLSSVAGTELDLSMPSRQSIDVRLFASDGKSLRVLAAGAYGPGAVHFNLTARDNQGKALAPGAYYLRVMTPWFSRVEPIQIH